MQQLSRPYQIALGALLVLVLAWFTVLKPSAAAEEVAPPPPGASAGTTAPGAAGLGRAVDKAKGAAAASGANAAASQAAAADAGETAAASTEKPSAAGKRARSTTGTTGPAAARPPAADPSAPILRDVARGKVAVLLFFNREAADDRAVRRALRATDRRGGKVVVRAAPIARVAEYAAITRGVNVVQAPTILVIGKGNRARTLVGFTDTRAIDQLVSDVGGADFRRRR